MTMTLTNDSLILLGLMVVGLTLCLYGYCKEGGDAIELQQQQQHEAVLLQEVNQDDVLEETIPPTPSSGGGGTGAAKLGRQGAAAADAQPHPPAAPVANPLSQQQEQQRDETTMTTMAVGAVAPTGTAVLGTAAALVGDAATTVTTTITPASTTPAATHGTTTTSSAAAAPSDKVIDESRNRLVVPAVASPPPHPSPPPAAAERDGARNEANANEETALDGTILVQQQYRVPYNLTHMRTIFRNPNPGMISSSQMIYNLHNIATWASAGLPIENNEEEEEDEEEEYNAGYWKRKSSKLDYDKVFAIVTDCRNKFPAINHALHELFHLLYRKNLNVHELKYKFYVSIAEALDGCPKYIKWIVPYYRRSVPDELEEEEDNNSFSEVGINQDTEDDEVVEEATLPRVAAVSSPLMVYDTTTTTTTAPSDTFLLDGNQDAAATTAVEQRTSTGPYIRMNREHLTFQLDVSVVEERTSISNITTGDDVLTTFVTETRNSNPRIDLIPKQEEGEMFVYTIQGDTIQGDIRYTSPEFRGTPLTDILGRKPGNTTIITLTIESAAAAVTESPHTRTISFSNRNDGDNMNPTRTAFSFTSEEEHDALDFDLSGNGDSNDENTTSNDGDKDVEEEDKVELEVETVMPRPLESTPGKLPRKLQSKLGKYWKDDDDNNDDDVGGGGGATTVPTKKRVAAAVSAVTRTVRSKTKKKPGIKKGTKLKRTKSKQVWFNGVHIYHHKYSHKKIKVTEFCRGNLSDERFTGSTSECNGFYEKYARYKEGELKNPSGDDRGFNVAGVTELQTEGTSDVFDFPSGDDSSMAATVRSSRRKRKRNNTGGSSNSQQKKKPYIPTKEDDASDPEWKLPSDGDDDDDDE